MILLLGFSSDDPEGGQVEYQVNGPEVLRLAALCEQPGVTIGSWWATVNFFHEALTSAQIEERFREGGEPSQRELLDPSTA